MPHQDLIVDGVRYPSVTEVLGDRPKPWLDKWRTKWGVLADRKMNAAARVGTMFHTLVELLVKNKNVYFTGAKRIDGMLTSFDNWYTMSRLCVTETELHVISKFYKYQGTFDAVGYFSSEPKSLVLLDWKTSSGIYPEYAEQLVAYAQAYYEQTGIWIKRGVIVHVSKGKPNHRLIVKEYKLNKRLLNKFLKRLKEYNDAR